MHRAEQEFHPSGGGFYNSPLWHQYLGLVCSPPRTPDVVFQVIDLQTWPWWSRSAGRQGRCFAGWRAPVLGRWLTADCWAAPQWCDELHAAAQTQAVNNTPPAGYIRTVYIRRQQLFFHSNAEFI